MQTFEDSTDIIASLIDDEDMTKEELVALESAGDSMAFTQSLWNLLRDQGLITDSYDPDFYIMEKAIDLLYGELAAATLMFSDPSFDLSREIDKVITLFEGTNRSLAKADVDNVVPHEVIQGFKAFANRLTNAKLVRDELNKRGQA